MNEKNKIILKDAFKNFTLDQDKVKTPEETTFEFKNKLKSLNLDILEQTVRIDNGRLDIPVFFSICGKDAISATNTKKQMGKGATPAQAEASAVMELAERFSFFSFCKEEKNFTVKKYKDLNKEEVIPFELIAKSVHDESQDVEEARKIFENMEFKWTWGFNLSQNKEILIPFDWFFEINEFNGPSAGNCQEEAISQGICEIVERHVSSIISNQKVKVPLIDIYSASDIMVLEMLKKYEKAGIKLFVSDFTLDMGIPSIGVLAYDPSTFPKKSEIVWTAGTTPSPQKAFSRALTEVAQLAGDFNSGSNYLASGLPKFRDLSQADFIINNNSTISINTLPDISNANIKIEVENCLKALKRKDMEVILINTTHKELQIPAFYTIIPGAHFRERAANTNILMFLGKHITKNNSPDNAIYKLSEIEKIFPEKYFIKFYLGTSYLSLDNPSTALTYFKKALNLNPKEEDMASIYSYMGVCLKDMGDYHKAIEILKEGERIDKERTDIYNLLGFCYFKLKDHEKSIEYFKNVLKIDPTSAIDYANVASNYREIGEKDKAIVNYEIALALDPSIQFAKENLKKLKQR
ncbi:MAG: YcaO-like family protein [Desulfobacterales bacterium]|nr:YcaO-like family protein [Desulfobacterales bacterium]MBF0395341.1 YcaO-like family protein [Desulfobacterales bacterium]